MIKKIIFVITQDEWGGAQRYVFDIATNLPRDQFDVLVMYGNEGSGEFSAKLNQRGIRNIKIKNLVRDLKPISDIKALFELFWVFKREKPDIVHLNSSKAGILGSVAAWSAGVPRVIYTVHGWVFNEPLSPFKKSFYRFAEKLTARFKTKIICVSDYDRRVALEVGIDTKEKLVTIHNGIDIEELNCYERDEARTRLSGISHAELKNNEIMIGTIANIYETKGLPYLVEASRELPNYTFLIIGEGLKRTTLQKIIREKRIANVILIGFIPEAYRYLKAFDCFVLPSVKEGYPYTLLEAVTAGIPTIATNVGGIPEILPQECLIPPADAKALTSKLRDYKSLPKRITLPSTISDMLNETIKVYD